jgi:hypothetical protein
MDIYIFLALAVGRPVLIGSWRVLAGPPTLPVDRRDPPRFFIYLWWLAVAVSVGLFWNLPPRFVWVALASFFIAFDFRQWLSWYYGPLRPLWRWRRTAPASAPSDCDPDTGQRKSQERIDEEEWRNPENWIDTWPKTYYCSARDSRVRPKGTLNFAYPEAYVAYWRFQIVVGALAAVMIAGIAVQLTMGG